MENKAKKAENKETEENQERTDCRRAIICRIIDSLRAQQVLIIK